MGAQVYENKKETYSEINECLSLWKLRHVEFMTAKDDPQNPMSFWLRRRDDFVSQVEVHSYQFLKESDGVYSFDSEKVSQFAVKTELRRTWKRLKIGEGKAENQNNMINALMGEVPCPPPPPPCPRPCPSAHVRCFLLCCPRALSLCCRRHRRRQRRQSWRRIWRGGGGGMSCMA